MIWAREEPRNGQLAIHGNEPRKLGLEPKAVTGGERASPATASLTPHQNEQAELHETTTAVGS
jgi:hypothetical protein